MKDAESERDSVRRVLKILESERKSLKGVLAAEIKEKEKAFAWAKEEEIERRNTLKLLKHAESHRDGLLAYTQKLERRIERLVANLNKSNQDGETCKAMLEVQIAEKNDLRIKIDSLQREHFNLKNSLQIVYQKVEELLKEMDRNESQLYLRIGKALGMIKKIKRPDFQ